MGGAKVQHERFGGANHLLLMRRSGRLASRMCFVYLARETGRDMVLTLGCEGKLKCIKSECVAHWLLCIRHAILVCFLSVRVCPFISTLGVGGCKIVTSLK